MGNILALLKTHVFGRRDRQNATSRSKPDHPERISADKLTTDKEAEQKLKSTSDATATQAAAAAASTNCSDFYLACRNNEMDTVQKLLEEIAFDDIDRVEPNGSTALHAACYHGHVQIVRLLLEAGADRAIANKYQCLPFDEALNDEIKELFLRVPNSNRLISNTGAIEWELMDDDVLENAVEERQIIKSLYEKFIKTGSVSKMFEKIEKNYVDKGLANTSGIPNIRRYFQKATKEEDPRWIIKAYTAETDFYRILNAEVASGASQYQSERRYIIALLLYHSTLDDYIFTGFAYRVMQINHDDLPKYQVGRCLMTKSFLSSSIDRKIAELFLYRQELTRRESGEKLRTKADGKLIKSWAMCIYRIRHRRTGLHIENTSQYANEGEILIMPYTVFKIEKVSQVKVSSLPDSPLMTEIELEECDQSAQT